MRILGIDPSYKNTGWCILSASEKECTVVKAGSIPVSLYRPKKVRPEMTEAENINAITDGIYYALTEGVDVAAIEKPPFMVHSGAGLLLQVFGAIKADLGLYVADYREFYPVTVKKLVSGSGKADKAQLARAVENRLTELWEFKNYDESDAAAIAMAYWIDRQNDDNGHRE